MEIQYDDRTCHPGTPRRGVNAQCMEELMLEIRRVTIRCLTAGIPKAGSYLHYKRKSSELWLVHIPELHVEIYLKN
jgi:hypothetical protein